MSEKKYTIEELRAARLQGRIEGREDAERYLQDRISKVCRTIHHLFRELLRIDSSEPIAGVLLPRVFCESLVKKLREENPDDWHANQIKFHMNRADRRLLVDMGKLLKEVESG